MELLDDKVLRDLVAEGLIRIASGLAAASESLVPNPAMDIVDWIESSVVIPTSVSTRSGLMVLTPVQRIIARKLQRPGVKRLTFLKTPRMGSTLFMAALLLYFSVHEGVDALYYERTDDAAQDFHDKKLYPLMTESMKVRALMRGDSRSGVQDGWSDRYLRNGAGVQLRSAFGNGAARAIRARFIGIDEASSPEYQPTGTNGEGNKIDLIWRRAQEFADPLMYIGGTPTTEGICIVTEEYRKGDRCVIEMPFECCGTWQPFEPDVQRVASRDIKRGPGIRYISDDHGRVEDVWYECGNPDCRSCIEETKKVPMMDQGRDLATAAPLDVGYASIFAWLAYSTDPQATWRDIAFQHFEQLSDPSKRQSFWNLTLAKCWVNEPPRALPVSELESRAIDLGGLAPEWATDAYAGIDHQEGGDNGVARSEMVVRVSGPNQRRHVIARHVISHYEQVDPETGEIEMVPCAPFTVPSMRQIWDILDKGVDTVDGRHLDISRTGSDVGWNMMEALKFCHHPESKKRKILPVRGRSEKGVRGTVLPPGMKSSKHTKSSLSFLLVSGQTVKDYLFKSLANPLGTNHSWSFPADISLVGEDFYEQVLSESLVETRPGSKLYMWQKIKQNAPNEALDCLVYSIVAEEYECARNRVTRQRLAVQVTSAEGDDNLRYNPVPGSVQPETVEDRPMAKAKDRPAVGGENVAAPPTAETPVRKPVSINVRTTPRKKTTTAAVAAAAPPPPPKAVRKTTRRPSLLNW